jgi:hypothetical protein
MKRHLSFSAIWLIGVVCLSVGTVAYADSNTRITVGVGSKVVSCDVYVRDNQKHIAKVLREGTEISVSWEINVETIRKYWLNHTVATVTVKRRVVPDLVSRSWQLIDVTSGISQRVFALQQAVRFLTRLEHFPVIDRSLLEGGHRYRMGVEVSEKEGDAERSWISAWLGSSNVVISAEFVLP